jgi:hypothetical protein
MALLLSASQLALLRRQFFSQLSGEDLSALSEELAELVGEAKSAASAAQSTANGAVAGAGTALQASDVAQAAADAAQAVANAAQSQAAAAVTSSQLSSALGPYATKVYADGAASAAVVGLAAETYVDGKFPAGRFTGGIEFQSTTPGQVVTLTVQDGWIMSFTDEVP